MAEFDAKRIVEDAQADKRLSPEIEQEILRAIARIDFGSIEVVVHDGKVVQIECREKFAWSATSRAARTRYVKSASRGNPARHHPRQASQTNGGGKQQIYIGDLTG